MIDTIHVLNIVLPILYCATFAVYAYDFAQHKELLHNSKRAFLFVTLMVHIFYLLARTVEFNHPPITNKTEIFTILAFSVACSYFLLELLTDIRGTGVFILLFSVIFQIFSSLYIDDLMEVKEVLRNRLLGAHVISALLGYSAITISAVHGLLFLALYKDIKLSKFGLIFNRLPSLETLERLSFVSVVIGFVLLTLSIVIGISWLPSAFPNFSYTDPKLISTGIVWLIYGVGILTKLIAKWYGKKVIVFSLVGFSVAILSLFLSNIIASSFHTFY
jgi:ABC-type transport system involved in cytochrome c biogenesis permease subunit